MKVSLNTIRLLNQLYGSAADPAPHGVKALADKIGAQLGAIEEIIDYGSQYEGVVIVRIVSCVDHPNADRLHVCKVDDGGQVQNVERDENGHIQIVCGAPNLRPGLLAAWLPPDSIVPSTIDKDPFKLEARDIRGQKSNGMLASARELGIGDDHEGILEVDADVEPGANFVEAYNLQGDVVIDIENKMFTHRPDCFGSLGVARELAGIQQQPFKSPAWYVLDPDVPAVEAEPLLLEVRNELPELVPRFTAIAMRDVEVKPSPVWLRILLSKLGLRSINNIVDYTNFFMLETGQPLHVYDYDKVVALSAQSHESTAFAKASTVRRVKGQEGAMLVIRHPKSGEKLKLLNGKEIEPRAEAILITAGDKAIALGGVMGGSETEVDEHTGNIIIECANFDMYSIRRTSMAHGLFTDGVTRFTKGQSPLQTKAVLAKIVDEIRQYAAGKVASELIDDNHVPADMLERGSMHPPVRVAPEFINARLGLDLAADEIKQLLENVEFKVELESRVNRLPQGFGGQASHESRETTFDQRTNEPANQFTITAPFWRTDIEIPEDIVEEVGRLYGYQHLPLELPRRDLTPAAKDPALELKSRIRDVLSRAGANEVLTYSFVPGNLIEKVGQDKSQAFQIANALSPDLQYYRLSLTPSLLEKVHPNSKAGHNKFALFEIGKVHGKAMLDDRGLPKEFERLAFVLAADQKAAQQYAGAAYYQAKYFLLYVLDAIGTHQSLELKPLAEAGRSEYRLIEQMLLPYNPDRAAVLWNGEMIVGVVGEFTSATAGALKLPAYCAGFEVFHSFFTIADNPKGYTPLPRFPKVEQDMCLKVATTLPYQQLFDFVRQTLDRLRPKNTTVSLNPVDIFRRPEDHDHKQITLRLGIASYERTLTDAEVAKLLDEVAAAAHDQFGAERI